MNQLNKSLLYMLIFTIITSAIGFTVVVKGYDSMYEISYYGQK